MESELKNNFAKTEITRELLCALAYSKQASPLVVTELYKLIRAQWPDYPEQAYEAEPKSLYLEDLLSELPSQSRAVAGKVARITHNLASIIYEYDQRDKALGLINQFDEHYPRQLLALPDPPQNLYYRGDVSLLTQTKLLSVVGTRQPHPSCEDEVKRIIDFCKDNMLTTVSGLAHGVDSLVHIISVLQQVKTIAVLPSPVDYPYPPSNFRLAQRIVNSGGLLLSEYHDNAEAGGRYLFPRRNRIIAALAPATVVVQAPVKSGALITANLAHEIGRDVFVSLFSPYADTLAGNYLLLDNDIAHPLTINNSQLKSDLGIENTGIGSFSEFRTKMQAQISQLSREERNVLKLISSGCDSITKVKQKLASGKFMPDDINVILAKLMIKGIITKDQFGRIRIIY